MPRSTKPVASKKLSTCAKRKGYRKPKDMPKRPLSAYNIFFKYERDRVLRSVASPFGYSHDDMHCTLGRNLSERTDRSKKVRPPPHGKIGFAELAKIIGQRWKSADSESRSYYEKLAHQEKERYKKEIQNWQKKKIVDMPAAEDADEGGFPAFVAPQPHVPRLVTAIPNRTTSAAPTSPQIFEKNRPVVRPVDTVPQSSPSLEEDHHHSISAKISPCENNMNAIPGLSHLSTTHPSFSMNPRLADSQTNRAHESSSLASNITAVSNARWSNQDAVCKIPPTQMEMDMLEFLTKFVVE